MDNPKKFQQSSDFSSSGNDASSILTVNVPNVTIPINTDSVHTATVNVSSSNIGRQIRAVISSNITNSKNVPSPYCSLQIPIIGIVGGYTYATADITRTSSGIIQLRVRVSNSGITGQSISIAGFSVTARVRTLKVD